MFQILYNLNNHSRLKMYCNFTYTIIATLDLKNKINGTVNLKSYSESIFVQKVNISNNYN